MKAKTGDLLIIKPEYLNDFNLHIGVITLVNTHIGAYEIRIIQWYKQHESPHTINLVATLADKSFDKYYDIVDSRSLTDLEKLVYNMEKFSN